MKTNDNSLSFYWKSLCDRESDDKLDKKDLKTFKKLLKSFNHLALNPKHPGLNSHEIETLLKIAGFKVWQSSVENHTPAAGRIFWAYGPNKNEMTILGFEPHPDDKKKSYAKVNLSLLPRAIPRRTESAYRGRSASYREHTPVRHTSGY
ncbi:MAG: hypothetical protein JW795_22310 [Chitinivibrionales bacterium]|nr:hypothetical protein [Chitinivibrionales bacterium]